MEVVLSKEQEKLYSKLYVSCADIFFAGYCARMLLKKGWHSQPWERRWTTYQQQAAFTTSLITAYARPFTRSRGWPKIPQELITYNLQERQLHDHLLQLRHTIYAHSDSESYRIRPWRAKGFKTDIVSAPALRLTAEEVSRFLPMTEKITGAMHAWMSDILAAASH